MSFPRYEKYKDSGVEWLGEVPEGWALARGDAYLRSLAKIMGADDLSGKEVFHYSIPVVQTTGDGQFEDGDEIDSSKLLVEHSQVLISKLNPRKNTVCLAWPHEVTTVCSGEFVPLQSDIMDLRFVYYLVSSENFKKRLESLVESATRSHQRVNPSDILKFRGAFPPLPEQHTIAAFLDHETGKIDALVAEQEKLIGLLKEKRQAVISHAVTKGLDPNARMKDSGVEWLGEVPEGWEVVPLGVIALMIQTGPFGSQLHSEDYVDNATPVINPANIKGGSLIPDWSCTITDEVVARLSQHKLNVGDIIFGRRGEMGRCALVSSAEEGWICGTGCLNVRLSNLVYPKFLSIFLRIGYVREWLQLESVGSTMDNLNTQILSRIKVPLPAISEQRTIAAFLDHETGKIDTLIEEAQKAIELMKERRTVLISAAVTGKIDVRGYEAARTEAQEAV